MYVFYDGDSLYFCDLAYQWLPADGGFSQGTSVSFDNNTDRHYLKAYL